MGPQAEGEQGIIGVAGGDAQPTVDRDRSVVHEMVDGVVELEGSANDERELRPEDGSVTCWLFRAGSAPAQVGLQDLPELVRHDENLVWMDLEGYEEDRLRDLIQPLGLHEISVRSALSSWQRPRLDIFPDSFFVSTTIARLDPQGFRVQASQLDLFVGANYLLSAHKLSLPFSDRIMARSYGNPALVQHDSAFMLYIILDELLGYHEDLREDLQVHVERMEQRALTDTSDVYLQDLIELKRYGFALRQLVDHHRAVFQGFVRPDFPFLEGDGVSGYFRDLDARLGRLLDDLTVAREAVNGAFDIYVSHVSHRTNNIIKILTIVSAVLFTDTFVVSFLARALETQYRSTPKPDLLSWFPALSCWTWRFYTPSVSSGGFKVEVRGPLSPRQEPCSPNGIGHPGQTVSAKSRHHEHATRLPGPVDHPARPNRRSLEYCASSGLG